MANQEFRIFKVSDQQLINAFLSIAQVCGASDNAKILLNIAKEYSKPIEAQLKEVNSNPTIQKILAAEAALIWQAQISFQNNWNASIRVTREEGSDTAKINFPNDLDSTLAILLISEARKHLQAYERTESIDKLLGNELAEFYRRREQGLLRLEELNQNLIQRNEEHRRELDSKYLILQEKLEKEITKEKENLKAECQKEKDILAEREKQLEDRARDLDDRDSRHVRRQIRKDLKDALASRAKEFTLTKKTSHKRIPIHILFIVMIVVFGMLLTRIFWIQFTESSFGTNSIFQIMRLALSTIGFAATITFYIRWNDHWFRQHADEEFRLKRLELDIDRASWVVEMALEWKEEKGTEIPQELIDRLTKGLFTDRGKQEKPKHPSEDLASALLSASTGLTVRIPGFGEAKIDRKGVRRFKEAASETKEVEE